ncbi:MAG TPA: aldo/keto reductase [Tepidisphaeraceae bacterium]|jgi:aryl-alcohol dehydrogenase-like predicted oxidoreductase|nr:aldo/keto reductase [Tepidisphaeraceae bacterium]
MQSRQLGNSSVRVTPIIFGAWAIGGWMWGGNEEQESLDAIRASIASGVNTIDTAAIYGMGHSEELVGKAIKGMRDKVVLATKCGMRWDSDEGSEPWKQKDNNGRDVTIYKNARPDSIAYECEQSLKRLGTDVIDLYQIHWPDVSTPVEDSMRAMLKLQEQGKIRAIGVSNYDVEWLRKAKAVAPVASLQPPYSLIQRKIESEILPFCRQNNIGVIVYSPLERGLLTGKVGPDRQFAPGDHRASHKYFTVENRKRVLAALEKIRPIAEKHKASFAQVVINWTVHEPGITAALVGARNAEQAEHNAKALSFTLTPEELSQIRAAFDEPSRVMNAS